MRPGTGTPRILVSLSVAGALLAMLVATSGDSEGDIPFPPEGYRDQIAADFALVEADEVLEVAFDAIGRNSGNPDDRGEFEWRVRLDLDEGVGPGHLTVRGPGLCARGA